jgi:hypothetical protein
MNSKLKKVKSYWMKIISTHSKGSISNHYFPTNMSMNKDRERYKSILVIKYVASFIREASVVAAQLLLIKSILSSA